MLREQNIVEILSTADNSGLDSAISAIDREDAAISRLFATAGGGGAAFTGLETDTRSAAAAMDQTGSAADALGSELDALGAKNVDISVQASTEVADAAVAQTKAQVEQLAQPHTVPVDADTTTAAGAIAQTKQAVDELTSPKTIPIKADTGEAMAGLSGIKEQLLALGSGAGAGTFASAAKGFSGLAAGGGVLNSVLGGMSASSVAAVAGIGALAVGTTALVGKALAGAGEMETYATQFGVLLGSADAAQKRIAELVQFAAKTPFEIPEVVKASKVLQTFGGDALATGDALTIVGDVAAGTNQPFDQMALLLGRIKVSLEGGLVPGDQLIQLQAMGALTVDGRKKIMEYAEALRNGAASSGDAWNVVTSQLGLFGGMMDKQSATFEGKLSNLSDAVGTTMRNLGQALLPVAKDITDGLITLVTAVGQAFLAAAPVIGAVGKVIGGIFSAVGLGLSIFVNLIGVVLQVGSAFAQILLYLTPVGWALQAVGAAAMWLWDSAFKPALTAIGDLFGSVFGWVVGTARTVVDAFLSVGEAVVGVAASIPGPWQDGAKAMKSSIEDMRASVQQWGKDTEDSASQAGAALGHGYAVQLQAGKDEVAGAAEDVLGTVPKAAEAASTKAVEVVKLLPGELAKALEEGQTDWQTQWDQYGKVMEDDLTEQAETAAIKSKLTSKLLLDGLKSKDPERHAWAVAMKQTLEDRLFALQNDVPELASKTMVSYDDALKAKQALVEATGGNISAALEAQFEMNLEKEGADVVITWAAGIASSRAAAAVRTAGNKVGKLLGGYLIGESPPPEGPLSRLETGAENAVQAYLARFEDTMTGAIPNVMNRALAVGAPSGFASGVAPGAAAVMTASGGPSVYIGQINVYLPEDWTGTPAETRNLSERLAHEIRASSLKAPLVPVQ